MLRRLHQPHTREEKKEQKREKNVRVHYIWQYSHGYTFCCFFEIRLASTMVLVLR
jgi:hypothetical protein